MQIKGVRLTPGQTDVYGVLRDYGPMADSALVPLAQHMAAVHQSSSSIRSRRAELTAKGLVKRVGEIKMPSGRKAQVHAVVR